MVWRKRRDKHGYGRAKYAGKVISAHRLAWQLFRGTIPNGLCVLHSCDNRPCVKPAHLFLGTFLDNAKDRDKKGRTAKGEKVGLAKLTENKVIEIRRVYSEGIVSQQYLAEKVGVHPSIVSDIIRRKTWKHLPHNERR